ncbi:MAG: transglycosylase domain-containing protein, partial [Roseiflexaceae bacterium]|nr:transglycosylase domain-containing protein [Roseiflexaceae bacterium]
VAIFLLLGIVAALFAGGVAFSSYVSLANSLKPRLAAIGTRDTFETSRIYDRNGALLYEFLGAGKRTHVALDQISPLLRQATIAIEDKTFYDNAGFDPLGISYALYMNLTSGQIAGGGSSITQQTIKGVVLTDEEVTTGDQYWRKIQEVILAQELTQQYTKDEILELYLNEIYYGNLSYGIEAAAQSYFGSSASDLSLAQSALLAGLPQLPAAYDPVTNSFLDGNVLPGVELGPTWSRNDAKLPSGLTPPKWRQIAVMRQMVQENLVSETAARAALAENLVFAAQERPLNAPHFVFYVRQQLEEKYGQQFANQGLSVYTTLDLNLQNLVQEQARARIDELAERNIHNAAVVVMQPNTGQVLAMVGSIDYTQVKPSATPGQPGNVLDGQVNVAIRDRQPGSALKPFTFLSAMERGATPATVWWDVPTEFVGGGGVYAPLNYNGKFNGPMRTRTALATSLNLPAVKALKFAGLQNTLDLLHRSGIKGLENGPDYYGLSLTLGGGEVTPLDLTTAYNTLASGGRYYPPVSVLKIVNARDELLEEFTPPTPSAVPARFDPDAITLPAQPGQQVLNPDHVAIITDMLADNQARAPVFGLDNRLQLSRPAAVKTGTTNDWRDAWAAGFTPYLTVGVWTGNNNNEPTAKVESVTSGGAIWHNVMEAVFADARFQKLLAAPYKGQLPAAFTLPRTVERRPLCKLPGPFNEYGEELFAREMLVARPGSTPTGTATATSTANAATGDREGCDVFASIVVANIGGEAVTTTNEAGEQVTSQQPRYCRVVDGVIVPEELLARVSVWKTPAIDRDEKIQFVWQGSGGGILSVESIPVCTNEAVAVIAPPGSIRMPDLRGLGENQAKEQLQALGFAGGNLIVQYQDRTIIPDIFDQTAPYAVVSSVPSAGTYVQPGEFIFLGVRAPDDTSVAPPLPTADPFSPPLPTADPFSPPVPTPNPDPGIAPGPPVELLPVPAP